MLRKSEQPTPEEGLMLPRICGGYTHLRSPEARKLIQRYTARVESLENKVVERFGRGNVALQFGAYVTHEMLEEGVEHRRRRPLPTHEKIAA